MKNRAIVLLTLCFVLAGISTTLAKKREPKPSDTLNSRSEEKADVGTGVNIYLLEDGNMDLSTARKKPISELVLRKKPWIASEDILMYDTSSHCIHLKKNIKTPLKVSLRGNPFVVTVDGARCY